MSSVPKDIVTDQPDPLQDARRERRLRAAACQARLTLASDALAAADLLLRLNWSIGQFGAEEKKG